MKRQFQFEISSLLTAPQESVWHRAMSMKGVNAELAPFVRMSFPSDKELLKPNVVELGKALFHSWILLFGFLPVDYHALSFARVDDEGFLERSSSIIHKLWEHERIIKAVADGTLVQDRVSFQPRIAALGYLLLPVYQAVFRHRHVSLRQYFQV
jgi:ligand-binding SRPBCC domain-containing protein